MIQTIWVTSFSEELYHATGKAMLDSFFKYRPYGIMLYNYDGDGLYVNSEHIINSLSNSLDVNPILIKFINDNANIIPKFFGGKAKKCNCPDPDAPKCRFHKKNCHYTYFNRNLIRWFKIYVGLNYVRKQYPNTRIIRVDSDCLFRQHISSDWLDDLFEDNDMVILQKVRPYPETGTTFYNFAGKNTHSLFDALIQRYVSGKFRKSPRWDDCYQLGTLKDKFVKAGNLKVKDVGGELKFHSDVVINSIIAPFLIHNKGTHSRVLGISK